eukprot:4492941-Alexandrium_andersonii.AAC.1
MPNRARGGRIRAAPRGDARRRRPLTRVRRRGNVRRLRQTLLPGTLGILELSDVTIYLGRRE